MSRTVWKFGVPIGERASFCLPLDTKVIHVGDQEVPDILMIWVEVDPTAPGVSWEFEVVGTGGPVPQGFEHAGSVILPPFVWHVYKRRVL